MSVMVADSGTSSAEDESVRVFVFASRPLKDEETTSANSDTDNFLPE
jgi:hypothetical protein